VRNTAANLWEYARYPPGVPAKRRPRRLHDPLILAHAGANYGIYGRHSNVAKARQGTCSEEYLSSEKYELRHWNLDRPESLRIHRPHQSDSPRESALQRDGNLCFQDGQSQVICYSKATNDLSVLSSSCAPGSVHKQTGWINLDSPARLTSQTFQAHDLLSDGRFLWRGLGIILNNAGKPAGTCHEGS